MEFILASGNAHKAEEFGKALVDSSFTITAPSSQIDVIEDGLSFQENALKKASAYFSRFKKPVMSDDSGIVVAAIPTELGIHSARFGGESLTDKERALKLLSKMEGAQDRSAYFICLLCFYVDSENIFFFEGRLSGLISESYDGETGFGYDPIFLGEGQNRSIASMPEWKFENSHRMKALASAKRFFEDRKS